MFKINKASLFKGKSSLLPSLLGLLLIMATPTLLNGQEEEPEQPEKYKSRLGLTTTQMMGDSIELTALLRAKIDDSYQKIGGAEIVFTGGLEGETLGKGTTNATGIARLLVSSKSIELDEEGYLSFQAAFEGNDELEPDEADVAILRAILSVTPIEEDSSLLLNISVKAINADSLTPLAEADVSVFVKRMIGRLKVGEEATDEAGEVQITFPTDLAGDDKGNLFITAFIEDFEEYGNLSATTVQPWGKTVSYAIEDLPRALWSPNPPIWMVATFFVLMTAVWGHYLYIYLKLRKMSKMGGER